MPNLSRQTSLTQSLCVGRTTVERRAPPNAAPTFSALPSDCRAELNALLSDIETCEREMSDKYTDLGNAPEMEAKRENLRSLRRHVELFGAEQRSQLEKPICDSLALATLLDCDAVNAEIDERAQRRLNAIFARIEELERLIGDAEPFRGRSLSVAVQEEVAAAALFDSERLADALRRLELVSEEVARQSLDRRMNYFTQSQKQELVQLLADCADIRAEFARGVEADPISAAVDALEANQSLLANATNAVAREHSIRETLTSARRDAEENREALLALQEGIKDNCHSLDAQIKS